MLYVARVFGNKPPRCEYLPSKMTGGIIRQDTTSITIMCIIVYHMLPVQQRLSRVPSLCSRPSQLTGQLLKPFTQVSYQHWRCSWPSERVRLLRSSSSAVIISSTGRLVGAPDLLDTGTRTQVSLPPPISCFHHRALLCSLSFDLQSSNRSLAFLVLSELTICTTTDCHSVLHSTVHCPATLPYVL